MDYAQPAGHEAKLVGYSLDRHKYPHDPPGADLRETKRRARTDFTAGRVFGRTEISVVGDVRQQLY